MICIFQVLVGLLMVVALPGVAVQRPPYYSHRPTQDDSPGPFRPVDHGYQFSSFRGPVSGQIKEITVPYVQPQTAHGVYGGSQQSRHPVSSVDYVAKPDYTFTFGVQDPESGNAQAHQESRDGDTVHGQYHVMEPDGTLRTVIYTADPVHGFQASVKYGPSGLPPPPPPTPSPTTGYTGAQEGGYTGAQQDRYRQPVHRFNVKRRPEYRNYDEYD